MSTVAIKKTPVEAKWNTQKNQQEAARAFANNCMNSMNILSKYGEEAVKEYQHANHKYQTEYFKSIGVKTPLELVKAKAEFEANVFGSKIEIEGDENNASLTYIECAIFNEMQKNCNVTPEKQAAMGKNFESCLQGFAKEWGFKADVKFDNNKATITFRK